MKNGRCLSVDGIAPEHQVRRNYQTDGLFVRTIHTAIIAWGMSKYLDEVTPKATV